MKHIRDAIRILDSFGKEAWENGETRMRSGGGNVEQVKVEEARTMIFWVSSPSTIKSNNKKLKR